MRSTENENLTKWGHIFSRKGDFIFQWEPEVWGQIWD